MPWSNKNLEIKWEHFTSKLEPSQKETWTAVITAGVAADVSRRLDNGRTKDEEDQPSSHETQLRTERAIAEMVATLYDESLDAFAQPHWQRQFHIFRQDYSNANAAFENNAKAFQWMYGRWAEFRLPVELIYRSFPSDLVANVWSFGMQARTMASTGLELKRVRRRNGPNRNAPLGAESRSNKPVPRGPIAGGFGANSSRQASRAG